MRVITHDADALVKQMIVFGCFCQYSRCDADAPTIAFGDLISRRRDHAGSRPGRGNKAVAGEARNAEVPPQVQ